MIADAADDAATATATTATAAAAVQAVRAWKRRRSMHLVDLDLHLVAHEARIDLPLTGELLDVFGCQDESSLDAARIHRVMRLLIGHCWTDSDQLTLSICRLDQIFQVLDGHFDDFGLLDATSFALQVMCRNELAEIGQTIVHPVSSALLDDPVRSRILFLHLHLVAAVELLTRAIIGRASDCVGCFDCCYF